MLHRDLKPSNILVALHDGVPVPRVIDFGIAKAMQRPLTDLTLFTQQDRMVGTPLYMSPEQAGAGGLDIDTRSDIYSLGVLLYELLTGRTPFDPDDLLRRGLDEIRRVIRESDPPKPSTALHTMAPEARTTVARRRQSDPARLTSLLRGDLDWIVMKALEKDRTRRYETVNGLTQDIRHYLAHEPVSAAAPGALYRFGKFARRNRTALSVSALIAAVLVAATAFSSWQAVRATRDRDAREMALQDAEAITGFISGVFESPDPLRSGYAVTVAETLDRAVEKLHDFDGYPDRRAKLESIIGRAYHHVGLEKKAIPLLEKVRDFYVAKQGLDSRGTMDAIGHLANSYREAGRRPEATQMEEQVFEYRRRTLGPTHPDTLGEMTMLASLYGEVNRQADALRLREEALAISKKRFGPEHPQTLMDMTGLAVSYAATGRPADALKLRGEILALSRKVNGPEHPDTILAMMNMSFSLINDGKPEDALQMRRDALALYQKVHGPDYQGTIWAGVMVADSCFYLGRLDEALALREEMVARSTKSKGPDEGATLWLGGRLAESYLAAGRMEEALDRFAKAPFDISEEPALPLKVAALQSWFGRQEEYTATCRRAVARDETALSDKGASCSARACLVRPSTDTQLLQRALHLARHAVELRKGSTRSPCWYLLTVGMAEYRCGDFPAAAATLLEALQHWNDDTTWRPKLAKATCEIYRALTLCRQGDKEAARALLATARDGMMPLPASDRQPLANGADHDDIASWLAWKEAAALLEQ